MPLVAGLLAVFVCIGLFSRAFNARARWLLIIAAAGIAIYITLK